MKYPEEEVKKEEVKKEEVPFPKDIEPRLPFNLKLARERFEEYFKVVDEMFTRAEAMTIDNEQTNVDATELGTQAMSLYKKIVATKEDVPNYKEAKEYVGAVDSLAAMLTEKLYSTSKVKDPATGKTMTVRTIVSITKEKISAYAVVLEAQRLRDEEVKRKVAEKYQKELDTEFGEGKLKVPEIQTPSKQTQPVRTESGTSYATHTWEYEVLERDLPRDLLMKVIDYILLKPLKDTELMDLVRRLDAVIKLCWVTWEETRIRKAVHDGLRQAEGLKIFEKIGTKFRTKK